MALTKQCLSVVAIAIAVNLLSCSPATETQPKGTGLDTNDAELGEADIEWGAGDGLLLAVIEDDSIGSAAYYGWANADGSDMQLIGLNAYTGEDYFNATLDDDGQPTKVDLGSMTVEYSYNPDGTFNFELTDDGDLVYSDFDLSTAKSIHQERTAKVNRDLLLASVDGVIEETTGLALTYTGAQYTGAKRDHPLYACLKNDEMVVKLAQIQCIITLVMNERINKIEQEQCPQYKQQLNQEMYQYCLNFITKQRKATYELSLAIRKTILAIAVKLYENPSCNERGIPGGATINAPVSSCDASGVLVISYGQAQPDQWGCTQDFTLTSKTSDPIVIAMHYLNAAYGANYWKVLGVLPSTGLTLTQSDLDTREVAVMYQRTECAWLYQADNFNPRDVGLKVIEIENKCTEKQ